MPSRDRKTDAEEVSGKRAVLEVLKADMPVARVRLSQTLDRDRTVDEIIHICGKKGIPVLREQKSADSHQRVVAEISTYPYAVLLDIFDRAKSDSAVRDGRSLVVVCDHIADTGNLGACIRIADCVGASGVIIANARAAQVTAGTFRSSAGASAHSLIARVPNIPSALDALKAEGFWVYGMSAGAGQAVWDVDLRGKVALVVGNEEKGLGSLVEKRCDLLVGLPQFGHVSSLNASSALSACAYAWLRQNMTGAPEGTDR